LGLIQQFFLWIACGI